MILAWACPFNCKKAVKNSQEQNALMKSQDE